MADISLPWGGDITKDETGDIAFVDGVTELRERIVRRFLTSAYQPPTAYLPSSPPDYVWDNTYGGNARLYVDRRLNKSQLQAIQKRLLDSCSKEAEVSVTTPPVVTSYFQNNALYVTGQVTLNNGQVVLIPLLELS